jgi:hypothetical protein
MKRLKITTPEKGLIFKITISNEGNQPIDMTEKLWITVGVKSSTRQYFDFFRQLETDYLYLPPNENNVRFVEVDFGSYQSIVGSYTAKLTFNFGSYATEGQPIETYPFEFNVMSEEAFQQQVQQNKGGTTIFNIGPVNVTLFDLSIGGSITIVSVGIVAYLWNRKRKRG